MAKIGPVVLIVGVLLTVLALLGPWWTLSVTSSSVALNSDWGLFGASATIRANSQTETEALNYATDSPKVGGVMMTGAIMVIVALVLGLVAAAVSFLAANRPGLRKAAPLAGLAGAAVAIVAPLYVMSAFPGALRADTGPSSAFPFEGFSGSLTQAGATAAWGGGFGWYLAFIAGVALLVGSVLALRAGAPMGPPAGYGPYGYAGYPSAPLPPPPGAYGAPPAPGQPSAAPPMETAAAPPPADPAPAAAASAPAASAGFCQSCGAQLPGPVKFCAACGAPQSPPA